jgi:putative membrane protein
MGGWGMVPVVVTSVLFWGALIAVAVLLARGSAASRPQAPAQVLADRLARGEIDEEEYRSRLALLREQA